MKNVFFYLAHIFTPVSDGYQQVIWGELIRSTDGNHFTVPHGPDLGREFGAAKLKRDWVGQVYYNSYSSKK